MRLQGAIFDLDGTLLDSMGIWKGLGVDLLRSLGQEPDPAAEERAKSMSAHQCAHFYCQWYKLPQKPEELEAMVDQRVGRFYAEEVQAKPDVEKFLSILKMEGVWMYVATATDRVHVEAALKHTGLLHYFRGIMTCREAGAGKESPAVYEKSLTRLRCRKEDCVVFEDSLYAIRTAREAGFRVAAVYDPASQADWEEIRGLADYEIRSYGEWLSQGL